MYLCKLVLLQREGIRKKERDRRKKREERGREIKDGEVLGKSEKTEEGSETVNPLPSEGLVRFCFAKVL